MNELELAYAIRDEYNRWDAEDLAENPRPVASNEPARILAEMGLMEPDAEEYEANQQRLSAEYAAAVNTENAELDAYGLAREERWAARRAEFLASLEPQQPRRRGSSNA